MRIHVENEWPTDGWLIAAMALAGKLRSSMSSQEGKSIPTLLVFPIGGTVRMLTVGLSYFPVVYEPTVFENYVHGTEPICLQQVLLSN